MEPASTGPGGLLRLSCVSPASRPGKRLAVTGLTPAGAAFLSPPIPACATVACVVGRRAAVARGFLVRGKAGNEGEQHAAAPSAGRCRVP